MCCKNILPAWINFVLCWYVNKTFCVAADYRRKPEEVEEVKEKKKKSETIDDFPEIDHEELK